MKKTEVEELLNLAGQFELKPSEDLDERIRNLIYENGPEKRKFLERIISPFFIRLAVVFFLIGVFFVVLGRIKAHQDQKDLIYQRIVSQIININEKKDVNKALALFSEDFFIQNNKGEYRRNIEELFRNYSPIQYKPEKEGVIVDRDSVLIMNKIRYSALAKDKRVSSIVMDGKERIYLKKDKSQWKIIAWVFEP